MSNQISGQKMDGDLNRLSQALPRSSSNIFVNIWGIVLFCISVCAVRHLFGYFGWADLVFWSLMVAVIPLFVRDYLEFRKQKLSVLNPGHAKNRGVRVLTKLIGLSVTFFLVLSCYWAAPMYWDTQKALEFYAPFFHLVSHGGWLFLIVSAVYVWWTDRSQQNPYDEYWQAGRFCLGRFKDCQNIVLLEYVKSWFIKAFFLPFMFCFLVRNMQAIVSGIDGELNFLSLFHYLLDVFYTVDILFGVLGYFWTLKLLNTHIQSTEPTLLGWWSCLACYSPFYAVVGIGLLPAQSDLPWDVWLSFDPAMLYFWGGMILFLTLIYALATVAFGYRMSNLTYRGIITSGPYRYTKHPAYICKVLSWWMVSLPFCSTWGIKGAIVQTLSMLAITVVYFVRAKTEENHLSNYPEYVQYAQWINEYGLFSFVGKLFPALRYSYERAVKSNSIVWFKKGRS